MPNNLVIIPKQFGFYPPNPNRRDEIWQDIIAGLDVALIALKYEKTPRYVSKLKSTIPKMKYPLRIENRKVVCSFCGQSGKSRMPLVFADENGNLVSFNRSQLCRLVIHHNHQTGEVLGLICLSCNSKQENWL